MSKTVVWVPEDDWAATLSADPALSGALSVEVWRSGVPLPETADVVQVYVPEYLGPPEVVDVMARLPSLEDLCRLILALADAPATFGATYEPDDGTENGWEHRHFARTLSRVFGKRAATVAMPKAVVKGAARLDRLVRGAKARLTPDRARYYCHPDWVVAAVARPPASLWTPAIRTATGLKATALWYQEQGWLR